MKDNCLTSLPGGARIAAFARAFVCGAAFVSGVLSMAATSGAPLRVSREEGPSASAPNLVFILADDLGWSDTTLNGTTRFYETPQLERLARRGLRFTQAYAAAPICSPTRASILTGLYPARLGLTSPACHLPTAVTQKPGLQKKGPATMKVLPAAPVTRLRTDLPSLGRSLKEAGYATGHFGKWHLGPEPYSPLEHGFDVDVPHWPGPSHPRSYQAPWLFPPELKFDGAPGQPIEERMAEEAVAFIRRNRDKRFFLNYWAFSVHGPYGGREDYEARFKARAEPGAEQRNALYAAMVKSLDDAVGRLMDTLDELGLSERTVVVFFSDNGGVHWSNMGKTGKTGAPAKGRDAAYAGVPVTTNAPLRGGKATIYEGGTREPLVIAWPGVTKPGSVTSALFSSVDFLPTFADGMGFAVPAVDGVSQWRVLQGGEAVRTSVFCHYPHGAGERPGNQPSAYVREGPWKLIRFFGDSPDGGARHELYHLEKDIGEGVDLAAREPARVRTLASRLDAWLQSTEAVIPVRNPDYAASAR